MAMEYGIDMLAAASQVVLCENALKVQHVDDDFMVQLAISAFKTGKYSDLVLKYLCENYTGPTDELINLWHAADKFSISSMKLDERILEQGIYTQIEPEKISDIFMEYYKRAGNEKLILAYISLVAHGYLHSGRCKADFIFDIIEKRYIGNRTLNDACQLALLKHFAEKTDITQAELEIEDTLLKYYIYNNILIFLRGLITDCWRNISSMTRHFYSMRVLRGLMLCCITAETRMAKSLIQRIWLRCTTAYT